MKAKVKLEKKPKGLNFQDLILQLSHFWVMQGCILQQPYDVEVGAGTMHPETFLRVLGPHAYRVGYVQPSRRPADGRYGENPNRLYKHSQFQVVLKPSPVDVQDLVRTRDEARAAGDFERSDAIRARLVEMGYEVMDTPEGTKVRRLD